MNTDVKSQAVEATGIRIDNVDQQFWSYVWKYKRTGLTRCIILITLAAISLIAYYSSSLPAINGAGNNFGFFFFLGLIPAGIVYVWIRLVKKSMVDGMLQQFAERNSYSYAASAPIDTTYGTLFRIGGKNKVTDVVRGSYAGHNLELFLHELAIPVGKNDEIFESTVLRLTLSGVLPNMLLIPKHRKRGKRLDYARYFEINNTITLEGNFSDRFTLYALPQNQIEALQVFNPEIMAIVEDEAGGYIVEFSGSQIFIYIDDYIATAADLQRLFSIAKRLSDELTPLAAGLANDIIIPGVPTNAAVAAANKSLLSDRMKSYFVMLIFAAILVAIFIATRKPTLP
jgi:hypothetical protein